MTTGQHKTLVPPPPYRNAVVVIAIAIGKIRTAVYFRRDQHLEPFIVQAVWLVGTLAGLLISARRLGRGLAQ